MKTKSPLFSKVTPEALESLTNRVPEFLRITPEVLEEVEADQKRLRERFSQHFTRLSQDESELKYALGYEKMAREFFAAVEAGYVPTDEERNFNARRLAQALQTQGRYAEALSVLITGPAQVHTDEDVARLQDEILEEIKAIETPDDSHCSCHTASQFPTTYIKKHVRVKGEQVPLIRCVVCKHLNATKQMPDDLALLERARAGKQTSDDKLFRK